MFLVNSKRLWVIYELVESLSSLEDTWLHFVEDGVRIPREGGALLSLGCNFQVASPFFVITSCRRGGAWLFELWPSSGRGGTSNSREVSPLLSPTKRGGTRAWIDGANPKRGGTRSQWLSPLFPIYKYKPSLPLLRVENILRILY